MPSAPSPTPTSSGHIADNIVHFARILRSAGLNLGPKQTLDAIEAVGHIGFESSQDFYWALHTTLISRHEEHDIFDQAFHIFWRDPQLLERLLPQMTAPLSELTERTSRRLAEALLGDNDLQDPPAETAFDLDARETLSAQETLRTKDFEQMSSAELAQATEALKHLRLTQDSIQTRRSRPAERGHLIDMRATMRASLRAGDIIPLKKRERLHKPPPLVVLCDISGSMSLYARTFLHFLHALTNQRSRVHTFLFGTRLTNITHYLQHRDVDEALAIVAGAVEDWDGGTRIGETLRRFNIDWARRVLGQGATVLLVTDGLDRDAGQGLENEITRLHRSSRRLIWLNPLLRYDQFEPKALGIRTMLPHVDEFRPVHNIASLAELVDALNSPPAKQHKAA